MMGAGMSKKPERLDHVVTPKGVTTPTCLQKHSANMGGSDPSERRVRLRRRALRGRNRTDKGRTRGSKEEPAHATDMMSRAKVQPDRTAGGSTEQRSRPKRLVDYSRARGCPPECHPTFGDDFECE
jgi:hypothetical protein